jgi:hypothetical protein
LGIIDKLRRAFIWSATDFVSGGRCKVAWLTVCRPKELGGLGITDLRQTRVALRVRWVWRDRCAGRPADCLERAVLGLFNAATVISIGDGRSTFFWTDRWLDGFCVRDISPMVFDAVGARKKRTTVAEALLNDNWVRLISGPLTMQLLVEFGRLCDCIDEVALSD